MSRRLPPHAHLDHLRKQAKDLLRAHRSDEPGADQRIAAHLKRLSGHQEGSALSLQEAQFVVAREYGFSDWASLAESVSSQGPHSLTLIRDVHTTMLPALHRVLAGSLEREVEVVIAEVQPLSFGDFLESLGASCWNYTFGLDGLAGGNLSFSLPLCAAFTEPEAGREAIQRRAADLAGPTGERWSRESFEPTAQVVKKLAVEIEVAWGIENTQRGIHDIVLRRTRSEFPMEDPNDPAFYIGCNVRAEDLEDLEMSLCYLRRVTDSLLRSAD